MIQDKEAKLRVSVVLATYNGSAYLVEQLQSLLNQTRQPGEVIIRDDASLDNTVEILRQFIGEHNLTWKIVEGKENQGYIGNFRKAMELSQGDVVFLCDQDDIWHPQKIEKMMAVMEENPHIEALASGYSLIDGNGTTMHTQRRFYSPPKRSPIISKVAKKRVFYENMAQGCAGAYRRNLIDRYCKINHGVSFPHDWALNLLAYQNNGFYYINEELLSYRIHEHNTVGITDAEQVILDRVPRLEYYRNCLADINDFPLQKSELEQFQRISAFTTIRICYLKEKRIVLWLKGALTFLDIWTEYFLLQYIKDLLLVLKGKLF